MKTKFYFPALLVLIIQVMVSGQSQGELNRKSCADITPSEGPGKQEAGNFNENSNADRLSKLQKEANYLDSVAEELKMAAKSRQSKEKGVMMLEMQSWHEQSVLIQIKASELSYIITFDKIAANKIILAGLMNEVKDIDILDFAQNLILDSERAMKLAAEMRRESKEEKNVSAKLGILGNAEEKEMTALNKQDRAIGVLNKNEMNCIVNSVSFQLTK